MKSSVVKRSIVVAGHKTSVSLEDAFWKGLKEIAGGLNVTLSDLVAAIILRGNRAICRQPFACSCSTSTESNCRTSIRDTTHGRI